MRPWRTRLALRRSRVQWALLAVVLLVATLASTLLATLYLLADATETFAARSALTDAPVEDLRVVVRVAPDEAATEVAVAVDSAAEAFFGDVPYRRAEHRETDLLSLPDTDGQPLAYLASIDDADAHVRMIAGAPPAAGEIAIPEQLAQDGELRVGDAVAIADVFGVNDEPPAVVSGVYAVIEPGSDAWRLDRFRGAAHNPATPLPFSGGRIVLDGYGPLLTTASSVESYPVGTVNLEYIPDFSMVSVAQTQALIERAADLERSTIAAVGRAGGDVRVTTRLDATLGGVVGSLAVTRSSVLVTGLLLLVLSVAALAQTARLMSERRHGEQALMVARGASGRQLLGLGLIEAVVLGAIVVAASPPLAWLAYGALSSRDAMARAGMDQDPGIPGATWAVAGLVAVLLVLVMVAPLLRRSASFIEAESAAARPRRAAAFQRGGVDLALLVLAGLAYWQLRSYESPVIADGGVARLDPLLAAGPALALLAGALVVVRLIPAASKALEGLASRGRRAVMPLAAWEVGRRSARAVSAVMLLTLAVSIGAFSLAYLTTWRQSQQDQAQYLHPADAVVTGLSGGTAAQFTAADRPDLGAAAAPAIEGDAVISTQLDLGFGDEEPEGRDVALVASTDAGLAVFGDGRAGAEGAAAIPLALDWTPPEASGIALPADADGFAMTVRPSTSATVLTDILVSLRAVVVDADGRTATVDLGVLPVDGETHAVEAPLGPLDELDDLARPVAITGFQSVWISTAGDTVDASALSSEGALTLRLSIDDLAALSLASVAPVLEADPVFASTALEVEPELTWYAKENQVDVRSLQPDDDQVRIEMLTSGTALRFRPASAVQTATPVLTELPIVLTSSLARRLTVDAGEQVRVGVDGTSILATVADVVPLLPGDAPRQEAVVVNLDALQLALVQAGAAAAVPGAWWVDIDDEALAPYAASLPPQAELTSRTGTAVALQEDPLRVATQAALWLVTGAAVALAAVGFAVHTVVTVRSRHLELAQLRAVGVGRSQLLRVVTVESVLLTALGVAFGLGLGVALAYLVGPLVAVGADGRPPLPSVTVQIPWATVGLLVVEAVAVVAVAVALVAGMVRRIDPAETLRTGD